MKAHGFRAMASTLLNESGNWSPDAIKRALAHKDRDSFARPIVVVHIGGKVSKWRSGGRTF
jgi:dTDP-4-amino-4,6-dideoxygalactose transaminase